MVARRSITLLTIFVLIVAVSARKCRRDETGKIVPASDDAAPAAPETPPAAPAPPVPAPEPSQAPKSDYPDSGDSEGEGVKAPSEGKDMPKEGAKPEKDTEDMPEEGAKPEKDTEDMPEEDVKSTEDSVEDMMPPLDEEETSDEVEEPPSDTEGKPAGEMESPSDTDDKPASKKCVWQQGGLNNVVMGTKGTAVGGWSENEFGIAFQAGDDNPEARYDEGTDAIDFKFKLDRPGKYYFTAITKSAGVTIFNDMWVKFDGGLKMVALKGDSKKKIPVDAWEKAYQNHYPNTSAVIYGVSGDPHRFQTLKLEADKVYTVSISGRSSKFEVAKLMMVKCSGNCTRSSLSSRGRFQEDELSQCV